MFVNNVKHSWLFCLPLLLIRFSSFTRIIVSKCFCIVDICDFLTKEIFYIEYWFVVDYIFKMPLRRFLLGLIFCTHMFMFIVALLLYAILHLIFVCFSPASWIVILWLAIQAIAWIVPLIWGLLTWGFVVVFGGKLWWITGLIPYVFLMEYNKSISNRM